MFRGIKLKKPLRSADEEDAHASSTLSLFRPEVAVARTAALPGEIAIFTPVAWQLITFLCFGLLVSAAVFFSFASYARVETAEGVIVPESGVAQISPGRRGVISDVFVTDGQSVEAGAPLVAVTLEDFTIDGRSPSAAIENLIGQQGAQLQAQSAARRWAAEAERRRADAQIKGLTGEISALELQFNLQREQLLSAEASMAQLEPVAEKGFVSAESMRQRRSDVLSKRQQLAQIQQAVTSRRAALAQAQAEATLAEAEVQSTLAALSADQRRLDQQLIDIRAGRAYLLRAPKAGRVTAFAARAGAIAVPEIPLMSIVPGGAQLQAEVSVPASAIGFVRPGQTVRLAIDTFPYQRFGTIGGEVVTVSRSAVLQPRKEGGFTPVYPVSIHLDRQTVQAFGAEQPLVPGMTVAARIVLQKQSLLQWVMQPLYAVHRR